MRGTLEERFWAKVNKQQGDACWEWTAFKNEQGYGLIGLGGRKNGHERAHRVSWELHYSNVPPGLYVCHRCDNRKCVRPDHLFLGTAKDNTSDMIRKGRGRGHFTAGMLDHRSNGGKYNALKTHCPRGHQYSKDNLVPRKNGKRDCKACQKARYAKRKETKHARPN